jgi:hypothetical protein
MSFFVTDKEVENLLEVASRKLQMPDGAERSFSGFRLMWKAFDFLVVCGKWSRRELVDLALRMNNGEVITACLLPKAHDGPGPVSTLEIEMLESPRVDPALIRTITTRKNGPRLSLDECLHNTVSSLYRELQARLG